MDHITTEQRKEMWNAHGRQCVYCHQYMTFKSMTVDHIKPKSKGGKDNPANLLPACKSCNSMKGTKTLHQFGFRLVRGKKKSRRNTK